MERGRMWVEIAAIFIPRSRDHRHSHQSIYEPPARSDGKRILVDRLWPRGMTRKDAHVLANVGQEEVQGIQRMFVAHIILSRVRLTRTTRIAHRQERFGRKPNILSSGGIVSPPATTENATTPKVAITISLRHASEGGSASANARESAPRSPPHHTRCCS
jgi:hypothetical protein